MDILLTCIGHSDPYTIGSSDAIIPGPLITLLEERKFSIVYLFWAESDDMNKRAHKVLESIEKLHRGLRVEYASFESPDPTNMNMLLPQMSDRCSAILKRHAKDSPRYWVQASGGTPQMQAVWGILSASKYVPSKLIAIRPRYLKGIQPPYSYEVDFDLPGSIRDLQRDKVEEMLQSQQKEIDRLRWKVEKLSAEATGQAEKLDADNLPHGFSLTEYLRTEKRRMYAAALLKHPESAADAARMLGIPPHTFRMEAERMGLRPRNSAGKD